jgi:hypothetical protein
VAWLRAALALLAAGAVGAVLLSGGSSADPRTAVGLPGLPPPFLGTAVAGGGAVTAAIDAYGDVVDLRAPGPAGEASIDNPADRQAAGSVPADTGIVPRVAVGGDAALPLWRADAVTQRYLARTNVVRTVARLGRARVVVTAAAAGQALALLVTASGPPGVRVAPAVGVRLAAGGRCVQSRAARRLALVCRTGSRAGRPPPDRRDLADGASGLHPLGTIGDQRPDGDDAQDDRGGGGRWEQRRGAAAVEARARRIVAGAAAGDQRWIARARPLARTAPDWARRMYQRSLLTLRALTDRRTGAGAAGARDGWAYVWPRDAGTAALAFAAAGYRSEARRVARFLFHLDPGAAARFHGDGSPVPGRQAQGDGAAWIAVAARAAGLRPPTPSPAWRNRPDYQEGAPGNYLANAIAHVFAADRPKTLLYRGKSTRRRAVDRIEDAFAVTGGIVRAAGEPSSGLDSAAAWAVRPFPAPALFPAVRRTLLRLASERGRFGITPGEGWPGVDPWTAPTAWSAWSFAALSDRRRGGGASSRAVADRDRGVALGLLADLRRASTPAGALPERVDARTGIPRSTTPLAWSHAFAVLALRQLWP